MTIKDIHILAVALTFLSFSLRGIWMIQKSSLLANIWVKVVPHIIDTVLLGSAIVLAIRIQQYPGTHDWLTAKVLALLLYISLGSIALKRGKTKTIRIAAWVGALIAFFYIVAVALTRQPIPVLT